MALLKVKFPHRDEDGRWYAAGDYREVPDHLVERFIQPYPGIGFPVLSKDHNTKVAELVESSVEELHAKSAKASKPEAPVAEEPKSEEPAAPEDTEVDETEPVEEAPKSRKRGK